MINEQIMHVHYTYVLSLNISQLLYSHIYIYRYRHIAKVTICLLTYNDYELITWDSGCSN